MAINQWDKGSSNNGPNAYKKGNRTNSYRASEHLIAANNYYKEHVSKYKKIAQSHRERCRWKQENVMELYTRLQDYIQDRKDKDLPITVSGLILAAGVNADMWRKMQAGEYDYRCQEYIDMLDVDVDSITTFVDDYPVYVDGQGRQVLLMPMSCVAEKALLQQQEQTEERLYLKGRVGDIFALKAQHGWREDDTPRTVNQTLVIASPDEAERAIKMLK